MLPRNHPDRIQITFDEHRLVANVGLLLPITLALHLGLPQLVDRHLDLGGAPGRANPGDKMMTLVACAPRFRGGRLWPGETASPPPMCCAPGGRPGLWAVGQGAIHPGDVPAQLSVGPRPSVTNLRRLECAAAGIPGD